MDHLSTAMIPVQTVAYAAKASEDRVRAHWPLLYAALERQGIADGWTQIAMIATVAVETAHQFAPIAEFASGEKYEGRLDLGNTQPGDGPRYKGRGFIQITGRLNYRFYGARVHADLIGQPELALQPTLAAEIAALYFHDRKINLYANAGNWRRVRSAVNGGQNGWEDFSTVLTRLGVVV